MQHKRQTPQLQDLQIPQQSDIPEEVIPLFHQDGQHDTPSRSKVLYDVALLGLLVVDLLIILVDKILMSSLAVKVMTMIDMGAWSEQYHSVYHVTLSAIGGIFTVFWVGELCVRWVRAVIKKTYFRWFFFPFVHWYEVLACFPTFRALRLLRAGVIIKRLHGLNIKVIPERWLKSAQFYYHVILEELSDRVILTAIDNFREQMAQSTTHGQLVQATIDKNRADLEAVILDLLRAELAPKLQQAFLAHAGEKLSYDVGIAVEKALTDTPELRRYLKLIPIAGAMIEAQITNVGRHIGENVTTAINHHLFDDRVLDELMIQIAKGVAAIDTSRPQLQKLTKAVIEDALSAFEKQVKLQQWKHKEQLPL